MKQLLLYFLVFVGSALLLIQCAKMFPSKDGFSKYLPKENTKTAVAINNKQDNASSPIHNISTLKSGFKHSVITPFFKNSVFPYKTLIYNNFHSLFNNPYISLNNYDLAHKYKNKSPGINN
jgi:hypothetical protein